MAYASRSGRASTSSSNPRAHAICDRCGFRYNHDNLQWQFDWRGATMQNIRILVCNTCLDDPQQQQRAIVVPADPVPILNPRVQDFRVAETDYRTASGPTKIDFFTGIPVPGNTHLITETQQNRVTQPIGVPSDLDQNAIMPLEGKSHYHVTLSPLSVFSNGDATVTVSFGSPHGLMTDDQISVEGLSNSHASGAYSITVTTGTQFTYQTNTAIPAGPLMTDTMLMVTAHIGLPLGFNQIPQTGI